MSEPVSDVELLVLMKNAQKEAAQSIAKYVPVDWVMKADGTRIITATVRVYT